MQHTYSKMFNRFLNIFNFKKMVEKSFYNPPRKNFQTHGLAKYFIINEFMVMNHSIITLKPKVKINKIHVLFFHGGAYVLQGSAMHLKLIKNIALEANCKVSYIDYPLAPENTYVQTFEMVQKSYNQLIEKYPDDDFMLMGDSAGGGLVLAFAQKLVNVNVSKLPLKIILFSPWIELSMLNPLIKQQELKDKILPLNGLKYAARKYAGDADLNNYLLSPINGNFDGLPPTVVFYGTEELFYPDIERLKEKTKDLENFKFYKFEGMQHDWVIFPIPEAKEAIKNAIDFILSD